MKNHEYKVILTNGTVETTYNKYTANEEQAIILAQAEAINNGYGYKLVSIEEV